MAGMGLKSSHFRSQQRQFGRNHLPNNIEIDAEMAMNQAIAHPCHTFPWDIRILDTQLLRDTFGGLADDFDISDDGILSLDVLAEGFV